jgi:hypothetical protein
LHDSFVQTRHIVFLFLPLFLTIFPYLHLHQIPILNTIIPTPPPSTNVPSAPSQNQIQGIHSIQQAPLDQLTSMTMQTLNHLVPTLHLIKYSHATIMRSQNTKTGEFLTKKKGVQKRFFFHTVFQNQPPLPLPPPPPPLPLRLLFIP